MSLGRQFLVPAGVLALLGATFAFYVALVWRWVDCHAEDWSECRTPGPVQLVLAGAGIAPAAVTLVLAIVGRGRPWRWFLTTATVYGAWAVAANATIG